MILGLRDMKGVGYDICARIADDTLIFKHDNDRNKVNYVQNKEEIMQKCIDMNDEFACYQLLQIDQHHSMVQAKDKEKQDSEESKEDGRFASRRL